MRKCVQDLEKFLNKWYITFPQTSFLLLCPVYCLTPSNSLSLIFSDLSDPDLFFDSGLLLWQWLDKLRNKGNITDDEYHEICFLLDKIEKISRIVDEWRADGEFVKSGDDYMSQVEEVLEND